MTAAVSPPLRILMAEDEPLAAEVLQEALADEGFEVTAAADGQEALEIAESGSAFDLLLTDLRMPRLDGAGLIRRLRAMRPELPVVVMTGFPPPGGVASLQHGPGPLHLMTKPIEVARLVATLRSAAAQA